MQSPSKRRVNKPGSCVQTGARGNVESKPCNSDWEAEIAAYDAACDAEDHEFRSHNIVIRESGNSELTAEENEVFHLVLRGIPCPEIAEMYGVDEDLITGLVEIIRAKLSLSD